MNRWQAAVQEFHEATGGLGDITSEKGRILRAKLIMEEAVETVAALGFEVNGEIFGRNGTKLAEFYKEMEPPNLIEFIDGMCDLIYVTCGGAVNARIDLERHFEAVHTANMMKLTGPKREDGKQLKPEGWKPPDHEAILDGYHKIDCGGRVPCQC